MILITGGKGYIGRNLDIPNSIKVDKEIDILELDQPNIKPIEGIIHLAAISRVKWCKEDPVEALRVNVVGTGAVLELARRKRAWVIYISSREAQFPHNIYALTKQFAESLCTYYANTHKLRVVILRLGDVFGKDDHFDKAITNIHRLAREDKDIILTNPEQAFYPTHIDTVVRNISEVVKDIRKAKSNYFKLKEQVLAPHTLKELTDIIVEITKSKSNIIIKDEKSTRL